MKYCEQELGEDEVFLGNTQLAHWKPEYYNELKTIRIGEQALELSGKEIDRDYMRPLFIGKSEFEKYNKIMQGRLERKGAR